MNIIKNTVCLLFLCVGLYQTSASADQQLDSLKYISSAGAPFLTLKMLDQAQPGVDQDLYEWILWEQERFNILSQWEQWNELLVRIEGLPRDLPVQFLQQASSYRIRSYIALGQNETARQLLREQLWKLDAGSSSEYLNWRQLVIQTYLNDNRIDDARVAMLRLQQDFNQDDSEWRLLRARVLMQAERYDEVIDLLSSRLDWKSLSMKLLAEYRNNLHSAQSLWDLARKRIEFIKDDDRQLATYWEIAAIAARNMSPLNEVIAIESRLALPVTESVTQLRIDADQLWQAYQRYARVVGNRSQLLVGDDDSWLELAANVGEVTPVKARSLFALLLTESTKPSVQREAAAGFMQTLDTELDSNQALLDKLFNHSNQFADANRIPVRIRFELVDLALKKANIVQATRLMSDLHSIPQDSRPFDWLLRQSRVLLLGGKLEKGDEVLTELLALYTQPTEADTDKVLQVLFDLQTLKANEQAIKHFRKLLNLALEPRQRREILFWMADSFKAMNQYERAALMYLQSAMFNGPDSMDPWAQTARYNAAESLQKAGLVDDARRVFESLLAVTKEPARRSVLRHNIQQLWLTQQAG
jgi:tetratricopeptide (TPR) repeat protein